ncbi:MAG: alpha/beta hydrolase family protein [Tepidiformaceae bacterium]
MHRVWLATFAVVLGLLVAGCSGDDGEDAPATQVLTYIDPAFVALDGAEAAFGRLDDALYQIEVPDEWNGELVLWAHGYVASNEIAVQEPPRALREAFIEGGYAWAASSFRANGYVPGIGLEDTLALREHFVEEYEEPTRTYLAGASMGGNVVTLALEQHPDTFDGALALCGALGGVEQIDYLLSWALLAEHFAEVELPFGEEGSTFATMLFGSVAPALGTAAEPKEAGLAFRNAVMHLGGGPRPFFEEGYLRQYTSNFALLLVDPAREQAIAAASTNVGTEYAIDEGFGITSAELDAAIRRIEPDGDARSGDDGRETAPPTGRITVPLLTLHNTGDVFVPITHEASYAEKARAVGTDDLLVQRAIRAGGHCAFSTDEVTTAWTDLVGWVEEGGRPGGDDLTGDLTDIGRAYTTPLRTGDPGGLR